MPALSASQREPEPACTLPDEVLARRERRLPLARYLTALGHDVTAIVRDYERGLLDPAVLAIAHSEQRILITNDGDFRSLVETRRLPHAGIIWLRLNDEKTSAKIARLQTVLRDHAEHLSAQRCLEVTSDAVELFGLPV